MPFAHPLQCVVSAWRFSVRSGIFSGLGNLGLEHSKQHYATGEWWPPGLGRATTENERKKVRKAINEWADGDAIAAHVGYDNDLFCTHDDGRGAGQNSVFSQTHRAWLTEA